MANGAVTLECSQEKVVGDKFRWNAAVLAINSLGLENPISKTESEYEAKLTKGLMSIFRLLIEASSLAALIKSKMDL